MMQELYFERSQYFKFPSAFACAAVYTLHVASQIFFESVVYPNDGLYFTTRALHLAALFSDL